MPYRAFGGAGGAAGVVPSSYFSGLSAEQSSGDPDLYINGQDLNPSPYSTWKYQTSGDAARNAYNSLEAERARTYNSAEAAKQRECEEYMSNSAYQRAAADMSAAGINPALAFGGGANAASTPSGAQASASAAHTAQSGGASMAAIIGKIAAIAISKGLTAKFTNSALAAADNHKLVTAQIAHMAKQEINSAKEVDARAKYYRAKGSSDLYKTFPDPYEARAAYGLYND